MMIGFGWQVTAAVLGVVSLGFAGLVIADMISQRNCRDVETAAVIAVLLANAALCGRVVWGAF